MNALRFLMVASLLTLTGCGGGRLDRNSREILENADRVEVYRIDGRDMADGNPKPKDGKTIDGFPVISQGKDQGKEFAKKLGDILSDKQMHGNTSKCFWPGVAFRVWRGEDRVDVLICFMCDNFYCGPPAEKPKEVGGFDDTPLRSRLLQLAKEAFPDDKDIQALQDK